MVAADWLIVAIIGGMLLAMFAVAYPKLLGRSVKRLFGGGRGGGGGKSSASKK